MSLQIETSRAMSTRSLVLLLSGIVLTAALLTSSAFDDPLTSDGTYLTIMGRVIAGEINHPHFAANDPSVIPHPPLYQISLAAVTRLFGGDIFFFRLFGILCAAITCFLIFRIVGTLVTDGRTRSLAQVFSIGIYLLNPFGRLGIMIVDIDYTVVPPAILLACYLALRHFERPGAGSKAWVIAGQAIALWSKLTSSVLFPLALGVRVALEPRGKRDFLFVALVSAGGILVFAATWTIFALVADYPAAHLTRIVEVFTGKAGEGVRALRFARNGLGALLWFGPAFILMSFVFAIRTLWRSATDRTSRDLTLFAAYGCGLFLVYLVVGGITFTTPKYQYPCLALLSIVGGVTLARELKEDHVRWRPALGLVAAAGALQFIAGDPLYRFFAEFRRQTYAQGGQPAWSYLNTLLLDLAIIGIPIVAVIVWSLAGRPHDRFRRFAFSCALVMLGYNLGLGARQVGAGYSTTYNYGAKGAASVLDSMEPGKTVFVHEGAFYGLWDKQHRFVDLPSQDIRMRGPELVRFLKEANPDYMVFGLALNTIEHLLDMEQDADLQQYLRAEFDETPIGDFLLFTRDD